MARICFPTETRWPDLMPGDQLVAERLQALGHTLDAFPWDKPAVDWSVYDLVVLRSPWDYHLRAAEFGTWLDALDAGRIQVANPTDVIRWNMDKMYLSDLEEAGVLVLPSVWLPAGAQVTLADVLAEKGWQQGVIKPTVSAGAHKTLRVEAGNAAEMQGGFADLLQSGGVIVQEFAPEIQTHGEWSFIFFERRFSHAVVKRPRAGDFRVQMDFGGSSSAVEAPSALVQQAAAVLEAIETDLLYARVDAIERSGQLLLMELELIEPYLFQELHPAAPERMAQAIVAWLERN